MSPRASTASGKSPAKQSVPACQAAARPRGIARRASRVPEEDRRRFIAEAAYFKAEKRGFSEGGDLADWIEAEAEIDALLDSPGVG
ncbi:MAG: DUF2934 domain-containing protein [Betaproteobacteria bacterium]|nr:DUF2934 domain-containing protein [Betaproteobacteria bacterium]